ncbi:conserved hypothetical protein [Nostocoides japonicum T1-X7]|uniref:DUF4190 domain-containing protein n=1 Tax=Nostocoides japonicum T1-X7 TaxID=1194083 RepID=A0A077LVQ0_9MICO|nr:conserved hypothetical protein [Tetrasphaera japonica T1-X7]
MPPTPPTQPVPSSPTTPVPQAPAPEGGPYAPPSSPYSPPSSAGQGPPPPSPYAAPGPYGGEQSAYPGGPPQGSGSQGSPWAPPPHDPYGSPAPRSTPPPEQNPYGSSPYGSGTSPYAAGSNPYATGGSPYPAGPPGAPGALPGYAVPGSRSNTSAIVLLVLSAVLTVMCCLTQIPAAILGIVALSKKDSDPEGSARLTRIGWIAFAIGLVVGIIAAGVLITLGVWADNQSSGYSY